MWSRRQRRSAIAEPGDRDLIRHHWPAPLRPAFDALFALDDALGEVVASSSQPALGAIRLAWWREALERLDTAPPPPEPKLQALAAELLPRGISGAALAQLEDGWAALLDERIDAARAVRRGPLLFAIAAQLLGGDDPLLAEAGSLYALAQLRRRGLANFDPRPEDRSKLSGHRFPARLRPLTLFARLAARDLDRWPDQEAEATPGRAVALIGHRIGGRIA